MPRTDYKLRPGEKFVLVRMRRRPGRPRKPKALKMDRKVQCQFTPAEHTLLRQWAKKNGLRVPAAIRQILAGFFQQEKQAE